MDNDANDGSDSDLRYLKKDRRFLRQPPLSRRRQRKSSLFGKRKPFALWTRIFAFYGKREPKPSLFGERWPSLFAEGRRLWKEIRFLRRRRISRSQEKNKPLSETAAAFKKASRKSSLFGKRKPFALWTRIFAFYGKRESPPFEKYSRGSRRFGESCPSLFGEDHRFMERESRLLT
jgi:hypothetical protein